MKDRTGMFILAGSAADKVSYEASPYGMSLLTLSLLQGMSGLGLTPDKLVDVNTLFSYTRDEVPKLSRNINAIQKPVLHYPHDPSSFDIGLVDGVTIPLPKVKTVFIRIGFQNASGGGDDLNLEQSLAKHFRNLSGPGNVNDLIFWDVDQYPHGYSVNGVYTVKRNKVSVRGSLLKGSTRGTVVGPLSVNGKTNDLQALVQKIADDAYKMTK
jgi:hypothetical protein